MNLKINFNQFGNSKILVEKRFPCKKEITFDELIDDYLNVLEENEALDYKYNELKDEINEKYDEKEINPYEEYGVNEEDFH